MAAFKTAPKPESIAELMENLWEIDHQQRDANLQAKERELAEGLEALHEDNAQAQQALQAKQAQLTEETQSERARG